MVATDEHGGALASTSPPFHKYLPTSPTAATRHHRQ